MVEEKALSFVPVRHPNCWNFFSSESSHTSACPEAFRNPRKAGCCWEELLIFIFCARAHSAHLVAIATCKICAKFLHSNKSAPLDRRAGVDNTIMVLVPGLNVGIGVLILVVVWLLGIVAVLSMALVPKAR